MAFSIHTNHRLLFSIPAISYLILVAVCAVWPAMYEVQKEKEIPEPFVSELAQRGFELYGSYNCVTCHTQQIRGDERRAREIEGVRTIPVLAADARFGRDVASTRAEYAYQSPPMMGTQRTGPDLSSIGKRIPDAQWHYWHLYNPQSVSPDSLMPPHRWLFTTEEPSQDEAPDYDEVKIIQGLGVKGDRLWATPDARALVEYLLSLTRESVDVVIEVR
jgi:cytochrome c oxidase cbb3-type subunit 2